MVHLVGLQDHTADDELSSLESARFTQSIVLSWKAQTPQEIPVICGKPQCDDEGIGQKILNQKACS